MAGRANPSRDLRLGLQALETGAIDREQLITAVQVWATVRDQTLAEILSDRGALDAPALARLEDSVGGDLDVSQGLTKPSGKAHRPAPNQPDKDDDPDVTASVAFAGSVLEDDASDPLRAMSEDVGTGFAGRRFQVLRPHARGGLGEVFLAFDRELNRRVALKELQARLAHDPASQARFLQEAKVTGRLEHPGIVPVYSLGRYADGRPFYAMHFIQGETLRVAIDRFHQTGSAASDREARELGFRRLLRCVIDACNAVAYAHSRGVVHRDLKPENIMLGRFGETLVVDWGVAKLLVADHSEGDEPAPARDAAYAGLTQPGSVIGTPRYLSPEQASGEQERVSPASDVYSLGAILYCVLVGHDAFAEGDTRTVLERVRRGIFPAPRRLRRSIDAALESVCLRAMSLKPEDRFASPLDLATELESWLADVRYRDEHEQALGQVKASLTRLCLERAHNSFSREIHHEGMLWLARALGNAPSEPPELERLIRTSLWSWHVGAKLLERCLRHGGAVHAVAFCPEGRRLATAGEDQAVRIWDISTGSTLLHPLCHEGPVRAVAFSPNGRLVASAGDDGLIRRWDAVTGKPIGRPMRTNSPAAALGFTPDGSRLLAAGASTTPFLWDTSSGKPIHWADGPSAGVVAVAFAADRKTVALACEDGAVTLYETSGGRALGAPLSQGSDVRVLTFDPSGRQLLTGNRDGNARLWDIARNAAVVTLARQSEISASAFRPDGCAFATVCVDGSARLWDSSTGRPIGPRLHPESPVSCLAFRPDGTLLATGSPDGLIRLWCAASGLPIGPPLEQVGTVLKLVFSDDGRRLAACGSDASVRCWKTPSPVEGTAERVSWWVRVETGLEFDTGDAIRRMDGPTIWDARRQLSDLGGPPLRS
jgi:WD40 repeat protein/serine/threonine protein kinase